MSTNKLIRGMLAWACALALLPASVIAQDADEQIQSALERAQEAGIPVASLQSLVDEGRAKGIPMDRIADAVQARMDGLARAQQALAGVPDVETADVEVGADALGSGVSEAVLAEIANTAPSERRTVAIAALSSLVDSGILPEDARDRVQDALARGPEALQNLPAQARGAGAEPPMGGPPAGLPGAVPSGVGAPDGIPAPGGNIPEGAGPPSGTPSGPPSGLPGPGGA
jgi:hypothetical protein